MSRSVATVTPISNTTSSGTIVPLNNSRRGLQIFNDSTARLYLKYGSSASLSDYSLYLNAGEFWEMAEPIYSGIITGLWNAADASGKARVTEM